MVLLGFVDDVIELAWRYKMVLPTFASLPLLLAYSGPTTVLVPTWIQNLLNIGNSFDLGYIYLIYMGMLAVFCSNAINILAGVNGLEVGQSIVIAVAVMIHNVIEINSATFESAASDLSLPFSLTDSKLSEHAKQHLFSLQLTFPFVSTSLALLSFNWFPSRVFVGDTYTYFAGMFFAVVGILGHFAKTLLLFFLPQIINFVISIPQLFGLIPCPRHRIPKLNKTTGLLEPTPNLTLINFVLKVTGPLKENHLTMVLLLFQVFCCGIGLALRYSDWCGVIFF